MSVCFEDVKSLLSCKLAAAITKNSIFLYSSVTMNPKFANEVPGPMFSESRNMTKTLRKYSEVILN